MKKISLAILLLQLAMLGFAQTGKVLENLSLKSKILNMERKFAIYLPPDYDISQRSYPVLYLLHGGGDDHTGWVQFGEVLQIADKSIKDGISTSMIIVMPDANTGQSGYFNDILGQWKYEDFFFQEFMPYVEKTYRIRAEKQYRAVAGLSMGGGGSFMYALHHPQLFSAACPLSASVGPLSLEGLKNILKNRRIEVRDTTVIREYYNRHSTIALVNSLPDSLKNSVRWYIDCGDDDFLYEGNSLVHIAMKQKNIPHEYRVRDGMHSWEYWRTALPSVLSFITRGFHRH